jgi:hypothetical protein
VETTKKIKPYAKRLAPGFTLMGANGVVAIIDHIGVCVRKYSRDQESGKWIITNSLGQWIGYASDQQEAEYLASQYVNGEKV